MTSAVTCSVQVEYSKQAAKFISIQDKNTKLRIKRGIEGLTESPSKGDIKPLQGYINKTYRLRIGKLRIIYRYDTDTNKRQILFISEINNRGDIYK